MKKRALLLAVLLVCTAPAAVFAQDAGQVQAYCNDATLQVEVTGTAAQPQLDGRMLLMVYAPADAGSGIENDLPALAEGITGDTVVYVGQAYQDADGAFACSFSLPSDARPGLYTVHVSGGDTVLETDFYLVDEGLQQDCIARLKAAASAEAVKILMTEQYPQVFKLPTEAGSAYAALADPAPVWKAVFEGRAAFAEIADVQQAFADAVAEQGKAEADIAMLAQLNGAKTAEDVQAVLVQYALAIGIDLQDAIYTAHADAVHSQMLDAGPYTSEEQVTKAFYGGVAVTGINALGVGERDSVGKILTAYQAYLDLPGGYAGCEDKDTVHRLLLGMRPLADAEALQDALESAVKEAEEEEPENSGNGGSRPGGGGGSSSGGGGRGNSSTISLPQPEPIPEPVIPPEPIVVFRDLEDATWAADAINRLYDRGVISGVAEGVFAPGDTVTREQFLTILVKAFSLEEPGAACDFADVSPSDWFYPYVASAYTLGLSNGVGDTWFGAGQPVTRQDIATLCDRAARIAGYTVEGYGPAPEFTDAAEIGAYAADSVSLLYRCGVLNGYEDGSFAPLESATRAEAAKVIDQLLTYIGA